MINIDIESGKSKRLLTAGKYCPEDIVVTAEAGTQFTLTAATTPGATVTATLGDLTVTAVADASGKAVLILPEAGTWTVVATYNGQTVGTRTVDLKSEYAVAVADPILNNNDWDVIAAVSDAEAGENIWSIGDRKAETLNGTVGGIQLTNYAIYAYIIGFNHNAALEGRRRMHFLFGKTALSDGVDITFRDNSYGGSSTSTAGTYMNKTATNAGGWKNSYMRNTTCLEFKNALSEALKKVLKSVTKYTDNTGGSSTASAVTATTDEVFLPSEFEVYGTNARGNPSEASKQKQYDYYLAGNSNIKYGHSNLSTAITWWTRSPRADSSTEFVRVDLNGAVHTGGANLRYNFTPAFCV